LRGEICIEQFVWNDLMAILADDVRLVSHDQFESVALVPVKRCRGQYSYDSRARPTLHR
jgi:hypothetical protein